MISRRDAVLGTAAGLALSPAAFAFTPALRDTITRIERESGGRLGVAADDTSSGEKFAHRGDERFPICSTFKLLAAAAILSRVDRKQETLERRVRFTAKDLVVYSPVTEKRVGGDGMTLREICEAAMVLSDNTAGNLLLSALGGPAGITAYARSLGDQATRLDRIEPDLNEAVPGDPRDTTTPQAMMTNIKALVLGNALQESSRKQLADWLLGNKTGDARLRAQLPKDWRVGDKTGTGERGTTNDVGVIWPSGRGPIIVSAYLTETEAPAEQRNATLAAVGKALADSLSGR